MVHYNTREKLWEELSLIYVQCGVGQPISVTINRISTAGDMAALSDRPVTQENGGVVKLAANQPWTVLPPFDLGVKGDNLLLFNSQLLYMLHVNE